MMIYLQVFNIKLLLLLFFETYLSIFQKNLFFNLKVRRRTNKQDEDGDLLPGNL